MKKSHCTRFLSLILALVLSFSLCAPAFAAGQFSDVPENHWAYGDIMECANLGIVTGFEDSSFLPDDPVSSAQFIAMLTRVFYADEVAAVTVPAGQPWYYAYVKAAENVPVLPKNVSIGEAPMSRYEMAAVLDCVIFDKTVTLLVITTLEYQYRQGLIDERPTSDWNYQRLEAAKQAIKDWDSIPSQYSSAVAQCYALRALTGMSDGTFSGEQSMTRAQACIVITRMMDLVQGKLPAESSAPAAPAQPEQTQQPETPAGNGTLANGQPATPENVTAMLDQLKTKYPDGYAWGTQANLYAGASTAISKAFGTLRVNASLTSACGGFAGMVSDTIFGQNTCTEITNLADVRPGDVIIKYNNGATSHVAIVLYTQAPYTTGNNNATWRVYCASGNMNGGYVLWEHSYSMNSNGSSGDITYRFITRY